MRKYAFLLLLLASAATAFCQRAETPLTYNDYMKKSKNQKTLGLILTSAGTAGLVTTLVTDANQSVGGMFTTVFSLGTVEPEYKSYTGYYIAGAAAVTGGIIYLITAGKNKQKAAALQTTFKMETAPVLHTRGIKKSAYPSLSFAVTL